MIFGVGIQIFYILEEENAIFPIDYACFIVYNLISLIELVISISTMIYIGNRQSALFKLRKIYKIILYILIIFNMIIIIIFFFFFF